GIFCRRVRLIRSCGNCRIFSLTKRCCMPSSPPEKALLERASEADGEAFTELFNRTKIKLFGFLYKMTGSLPVTEDLVQDIYLLIWAERLRLAWIEHFQAYLFRSDPDAAIIAMRRMAADRQMRSHLQVRVRA